MPLFRYKAIEATGQTVTGTREGASRQDVVAMLLSEGQTPIDVSDAGTGGAEWWRALLPSEKKLSAKQRVHFTSKLATLVEAHIRIDQALKMIADASTNDQERQLADSVRRSVQGGMDLASALKRTGDFPGDYIAAVRAGEASGGLETTIEQLASRLERGLEFSERMQSALFYPILLLVLIGATMVLIFGFVLPQFEQIFASSGADLPFITSTMLAVGHFLRGFWWAIVIGLIAAFLGVRRLLSQPASRLPIDRWLLSSKMTVGLPLAAEASRFCQTLSLLIDRKVPLYDAVQLATDSVANLALKGELLRASEKLRTGGSLSSVAQSVGLFPPIMQQLVQVGEASSQLPQMLKKAGDILERELYNKLERLIAVIVPLMTIVMGAIVAGVIASVLVGVLAINEVAF